MLVFMIASFFPSVHQPTVKLPILTVKFTVLNRFYDAQPHQLDKSTVKIIV